MATKIVNCPDCKSTCTWHPLGGVQCVKCGYREQAAQAVPGAIASTDPGGIKPRINIRGGVMAELQERIDRDTGLDVVRVHVEPGKTLNLF